MGVSGSSGGRADHTNQKVAWLIPGSSSPCVEISLYQLDCVCVTVRQELLSHI